MIANFKTKATEDIYNGKQTKAALRICPEKLWKVTSRKLDLLDSVASLDELRVPPGNRLEALIGTQEGSIQHQDKQSVLNLFQVV